MTVAGSGTAEWDSGSINGIGALHIYSQLTIANDLDIDIDGTEVHLHGNTTWVGTGLISLSNSVHFNNTGYFEVQTDSFVMSADGSVSYFTNMGTVAKIGGYSTTFITAQYTAAGGSISGTNHDIDNIKHIIK